LWKLRLPKTNPQIDAKLRTVTIRIKDTLEPNTTYTYDFGNAIRDINEGKLLTETAAKFESRERLDLLFLLTYCDSVSVGYGSYPLWKDALLAESAGFLIASAVLFWFTARAFDARRPVRDAVFAVTISLGAYLLFARVLQLQLPSGLLRRWL